MTAQAAGREGAVILALGSTARILLETPRRYLSLGAIAVQVLPAIQLGQIAFCFDGRGRPVGYATWAFLTERVAMELGVDSTRVLHVSEWDEGSILWIMDFVAPMGHAMELARTVRSRLPSAHMFRGARWGADGAIRRAVSFRVKRTQERQLSGVRVS